MIKGTISVENARIAFRNFSGAATKFNPAGRRNFCLLLEEDLAQSMAEDGWNIRELQAREEGDAPQPYVQVVVAYYEEPEKQRFNPKIVLVTGQGKTLLDEETINVIDWADISKIDLVIRPYNWEVNGKTGIKAYLTKMFVTIVEDEIESKYYDVPEVN